MAFIVVYDASVLYPNTLRDLLIRVSRDGFGASQVDQRDSRRNVPRVEQEPAGHRAGQAGSPSAADDRSGQRLPRLRVRTPHRRTQAPGSSRSARPGSGDQDRCSGHRHQQSEVFPAADPRQWDVEAKSPDAFVLDQIGIDGRAVAACVQQIADSRIRPPQDMEDVLSQLERAGLVESIAALRAG
jgi:hypothetical protein